MHARSRSTIWLVVSVLVLVGFVSFATAEESSEADSKVAVVNGTVITKATFDNAMSRVQRQSLMAGKPIGAAATPEIKKEVLDSLIANELLYQKSQEEGIRIDSAEIDEQMTTVKKQFPSEAEFRAALAKMNLSEATLRSEYERSEAVEELIDKEIARNIAVSEEETKAYYDTNPDAFKKPERVKASHILIQFQPDADESERAKAREELAKIQKKLEKGEDFGALAKEFSQCPSAANGGDLGYFRRGQMVKPFEDAAFALEPGQTSDIIETRFGYHLIRVTDKEPESTIKYEDVQPRIMEFLKQQELQKEVTEYIDTLEENAKIERFLPE